MNNYTQGPFPFLQIHAFTSASFLGQLLLLQQMSGGRQSDDGICRPHSSTVDETSRKLAVLSEMNITLY